MKGALPFAFATLLVLCILGFFYSQLAVWESDQHDPKAYKVETKHNAGAVVGQLPPLSERSVASPLASIQPYCFTQLDYIINLI